MNRRDFMGTVVAGAAATQVARAGVMTATDAPAAWPRARWLEDGLIDAGGSHETYLFVVRRGGQRLDAREELEKAQSEETLRKLKADGVEVYHTHLYKGFGMAAERAEMEETKRVAAVAHRLGLKVDTYIQWDTLMYETFFAEEPRAQNWIQRDAGGHPIMLRYGFQQSFRYRPCFANQEYLDYLKKIVRYAVEEVKTDFIHFDNFDLSPEPESCHDRMCMLGFREFLRTKYTAQQRRERFGFENVDYVNPPAWNDSNPPGSMKVIFDPVIQEWIDYRCQVMADTLREMSLYAKSMNPNVAIEINPHGITGGNRAWEAAIDHSRILKWTDAFWTEADPVPGYIDGQLLSRIRSYKLARRYNNILLTYIAGDPLAMAESLAFNQTLGFVGSYPMTPVTKRYIDFYRENRKLFVGARDLATVAVLRSYPSITYDQPRVQLSTILVEQALIHAHIPFDLIFDEDLSSLAKYNTLVLPETECLSDAQIESIQKFVTAGGGLVATGTAGLYDQWRRLRVVPGLHSLIDSQVPARAYEEQVAASTAVGNPSRREFKKGRVAYLPAVEFDGPLPQFGSFFQVDARFWRAPRNGAEIVESVRWAARNRIPVEVSGPDYVVSNLVEQPANRRLMLHLVNYNSQKEASLDTVHLTIRLPEGQQAKQGVLYSPDIANPQELAGISTSGNISLNVPVKTYSILAVNW
ncbi:MAG: beta-galactosidase trimerization domain-containing protein [Terriglobia bacterium]